jgi:hypothetical protein
MGRERSNRRSLFPVIWRSLPCYGKNRPCYFAQANGRKVPANIALIRDREDFDRRTEIAPVFCPVILAGDWLADDCFRRQWF